MKLKLAIQTVDKKGTMRERSVEINQDSCIIGRASTDILLHDRGCSLHHTMLFEDEEGRLKLIDLHSTNGTYVNGERVVKRTVKAGDEVIIGETRVRIVEFTPSRFVGQPENELTKWSFPIVHYGEVVNMKTRKKGV